MIPTIEEYAALLRIDNVQLNKIYVKELKPMIFKKKLMKLTGMTDIWAKKQIKKKNEVSCDPWFSLRELVQNYLDVLKIVDLFALAIYRLIVFPKALGHVEVAVVDFFEKLRQGINPKVERTPFHMFSKTFSPLEAHLKKDWPKDITEQHWVSDWVPLLGLWGGVGYVSLMVQRQIDSQQFVPVTDGLAQSEFAFTGEGYMKRVRDTANSWRKIYLMELALYADTITEDYDIWRQRRVKSQLTPSIDVTHQNLFSEEISSELKLKAKAKKEEERVACVIIELRKKSVEYETLSQHLDDLLRALKEKNGQYDRDIHAYERALQEKDIHLGSLINEILKADAQIDAPKSYGCQTQRKNGEDGEDPKRVAKATGQVTTEGERFNGKILRRITRTKGSNGQNDGVDDSLSKRKGTYAEPQSRANQDPLYPPGFTPPHTHITQRGYHRRKTTVLGQHLVQPAHL
ncbi:hypothetical protein Golob_024015, partial [Gossypium lobatum]|nr:hypothetical protein [Gossypium lobatum]